MSRQPGPWKVQEGLGCARTQPKQQLHRIETPEERRKQTKRERGQKAAEGHHSESKTVLFANVTESFRSKSEASFWKFQSKTKKWEME